MVLNVKFETLTYSASSFGGEASAPLILGRSEASSGEAARDMVPPATGAPSGPNIAAQLWLWLSFQLISYFSFSAKPRPRPRLVFHYGDDDGPGIAVRLNRSLKRKLARLQRRGLIGGPSLREQEAHPENFSPTQLLEHMIRTRKWSRVKAYRLGFARAD